MTVSIAVGSGWVQFFSLVVGRVGLGQSADGLGWVGSGHTKWTHGQLCGAPVARAPPGLNAFWHTVLRC